MNLPFQLLAVTAAVLALTLAPAAAQPQKTLSKCQTTAAKGGAKYAANLTKSVGKCLDKIAAVLIADNLGNTAEAAKTCASSLRKIYNTENPDRVLTAKFLANVAKACDPSVNTSLQHMAGDVLDIVPPSVPEGIEAKNLDGWCTTFGGDGSLDTVAEWIDCDAQAVRCESLQRLSVIYPRLSEWLLAVASEILGLGSDQKYLDAATAALGVRFAVDANSDGVPDLNCGAGLTPGVDPLLPATGQMSCWNGSGTTCVCGAIGCSGHDGDLQAGQVRSFTVDNILGTITDEATGLMWEKKDDNNAGGMHDKDTTHTWANAFAVHLSLMNGTCDGDGVTSCLNDAACTGIGNGLCGHAGFRDWRLPNFLELLTILDMEQGPSSPPTTFPAFDATCSSACTIAGCSCTASAGYWSSTTVAGTPISAWNVNFSTGLAGTLAKTTPQAVRAVRGAVPP